MLPKIMWGIGGAGFFFATLGLFIIYLADPSRTVVLNVGQVIFDNQMFIVGKTMMYSGIVGCTLFALPWWR